ncbi:ABC transporter substrate-binding protein [Patulibacter sp.]|uniref:ABC transporter substrate-binding protein n=1 Tax=Patulibacter sp. TaxID=1912859 RepID=UPI00272549FE|nr:ABC transporter substrate-binding protein [Patulibacter sp.]MDO9408214.1 ABC transporter substrate-binding protein [Patulibacter sp.]
MTDRPTPRPTAARLTAALLATTATLALGACGGSEADRSGPAAGTTAPAGASAASGPTEVQLQNCGKAVSFPRPARRLFVNDGNMISMALAVGAGANVAAVSSMQRDAPVLRKYYGAAAVDGLRQVAKEYPARETVLAQRPDVVVAGWNYGWDETRKLTPAGLAQQGIAAYTLTESCRQGEGRARGVVDPWTALRTDLTNIGRVTAHEDGAQTAVADIDARLAALRRAPQAGRKPTVFLFDSGTNAVYSSGRFGAPQAILDAAGAKNALADLDDTWTEVSWERVIAARPDAFLFVDYPPQTFAQKVAVLRARAGVQDLPAVREGRFLNLPYAMWTSGPLNIEAAEQARTALEGWGLVPRSDIRPRDGSDAAE